MMNPHTNRTLHKNRTQTVPYKRHFQLLSRYAIGLFLLLAAALPVMAQGGLAEEPERMVPAVRLAYLGMATLVVWVIVFGLTFLTYLRQNRIERHVAEIEAGIKGQR